MFIIKNIIKITMTSLIIVMSFLIYKNFVYYLIPYNPLEEYYDTTPYNVNSYLYTNDNKRGSHISTHKYNTEYNNEIVFKYFKNLRLVPLSQNEYKREMSHIKNPNNRVEYSFGFENIGKLYINDIFLENLNIMYIHGDNIPQYHEGYFKIIDENLDYNYISKLIKGKED